jgi:hypothetical protein
MGSIPVQGTVPGLSVSGDAKAHLEADELLKRALLDPKDSKARHARAALPTRMPGFASQPIRIGWRIRCLDGLIGGAAS